MDPKTDKARDPIQVSIEAPKKLSGWDRAGLILPPRTEHEEAAAVCSMERVLSAMLHNGRLTPLAELPILVGKFQERDLRDLAYRAVTALDRKEAFDAIEKRADSLSEKLIGQLAISCVHEAQTPKSVNWTDMRERFESSWTDVKKELFHDSPEKRRVAQAWVRFALDKVRLPTSIRGEFSIVPDTLRSKVEEAFHWSLELRR
jgi:hypothetical protein